MNRGFRTSLVCLVVLGVTTCLSCAERAEHETAGETSHAPHWGYGEEDGPARWAGLSPDYALCGEGQRQSPIDLSDAELGDSFTVRRDYGAAQLKIARTEHVVDVLDNGHTIQVNYDKGSTLALDDGEFELVQYHFHLPSEHTVDGRHAAMELHLVHQSATGALAVLGVFLEEGDPNPNYAPLVENLPRQSGDTLHFEHVTLDVDDLLPRDPRYYRYEGSLTTPPCSEGVHWLVLVDPVELSREQIEAFRSVMEVNNRPVQPRNDRRLTIETAAE